MKKIMTRQLSLLLACLMVLGAVGNINVYAVTMGDAEICETIGMLEGDGNGVTEEYLQENPYRYQSAVLYLRLKGLEDEMLAFSYVGKDTFDDASGKSAYVQRLLAYLKANPDLGWVGIGNNLFDPLGQVTVQAYTKVMLEGLGYKEDLDFTWNNVFTFAKAKGFTKHNSNESSFTIEEVCEITVEALKSNTKNGAKLIDTLVEAGIINETKAVQVGLVEKPETDALMVEVISNTKLKLVFDKAIDQLLSNNIRVTVENNSKTITSVTQSLDKKEAIVEVYGLDFNKMVDVLVSGVYSDQVKQSQLLESVLVPSVYELFELKLMSDDFDNTLRADGLDIATLTAQLVSKADNDFVDVNANIVFNTTKGTINIPEVTMVGGQGSTDIRSSLSLTDLTAYVNVSITDAPSANYLEGLTGQLKLVYSPTETEDPQQALLNIVSASSVQNDKLAITYSGSILAADYKTLLLDEAGQAEWADIAGSQDATLMIDGQRVPILDILQVSATKLEFVLDTDSPGSVRPTTSLIQEGFIVGTSNYLKENATHTISYPSNVGGIIRANVAGVEYNTVDIMAPYCLGVVESNQVNLTIKFSESMAEDNIEGLRGDVNDKFVIDGQRLYLTASPNGATTTEMSLAAQKNYILATEIYVGSYDASTGESKRNMVFIKLDRSYALDASNHTMIVYPVADWAGLEDTTNRSTMNTFNFTVTIDTEIPTVTVTKQSSEQFIIQFSEEIYFKGNLAEAIELYKADDEENPLVQDENKNYEYLKEDYIITDITKTSDVGTKLLVEMIKDWTEYYSSNTTKDYYYETKHNPYSLKFVQNQISDEVGNYVVETWADLSIYNDYLAPEVVRVKDMSTMSEGIESGTKIYVELNEPVQVLDMNGNPSTVRLTPSEQETRIARGSDYDQSNVRGVTFEFTKGNDRVTAYIQAGSINAEDTYFTLVPVSKLTDGLWKLKITYLTDDIGNMMDTTTVDVNVPLNGEVTTETFISWAAFDNAGGTQTTDKDYIYIKFSKVMDSSTSGGVSRTTNYFINGASLPEGSTIQAGIEGITKSWDGVTIVMPHNAHKTFADDDCALILKVATTFKSTDGTILGTPYQMALEDTATNGNTYVNMDGLSDAGINRFDAKYVNEGHRGLISGNISGSAIVLTAKAYDNDQDGGIDKLNLVLSNAVQADGKEELIVGGKKFINTSIGLVTTLVYRYQTDDLGTTSTKGLDLQTADGTIIVSNDALLDMAQPVLLQAVAEINSLNVKLVFSEPVYHTGGGAFTTYDFFYTDGNATGGAGPLTYISSSSDGKEATVILSAQLNNLDKGVDRITPIAGNITDHKGNIIIQTAVTLN